MTRKKKETIDAYMKRRTAELIGEAVERGAPRSSESVIEQAGKECETAYSRGELAEVEIAAVISNAGSRRRKRFRANKWMCVDLVHAGQMSMFDLDKEIGQVHIEAHGIVGPFESTWTESDADSDLDYCTAKKLEAIDRWDKRTEDVEYCKKKLHEKNLHDHQESPPADADGA